MTMYQPNQYEVEARKWAMKFAPQIETAIRAGEDYMDELLAEVGPNVDEYAKAKIDRANGFLQADYRKANSAWAEAYRKAGF